MSLIRKEETIEYSRGEQCRVRGTRAPLLGARYEAWFTSGGSRFHGKGRYPEVEGLMLKQEALPEFYRMLVRLSKKIGDLEGSKLEVSPAGLRCIGSLSMWSQDMATLSEITGLGIETARRASFELYHAGYVSLVQSGVRTKMALTPKGWRAEDELVDEVLANELLNRAIEIYSQREAEHLKASAPRF